MADWAAPGEAEYNMKKKEIAVTQAMSEFCRRPDMRVQNGQIMIDQKMIGQKTIGQKMIGQIKHGPKTHLLCGLPTRATCQRIQNQSVPSIGRSRGAGNLSEGHRTTGVIYVTE